MKLTTVQARRWAADKRVLQAARRWAQARGDLNELHSMQTKPWNCALRLDDVDEAVAEWVREARRIDRRLAKAQQTKEKS